jgi:hypothetical protein
MLEACDGIERNV